MNRLDNANDRKRSGGDDGEEDEDEDGDEDDGDGEGTGSMGGGGAAPEPPPKIAPPLPPKRRWRAEMEGGVDLEKRLPMPPPRRRLR